MYDKIIPDWSAIQDAPKDALKVLSQGFPEEEEKEKDYRKAVDSICDYIMKLHSKSVLGSHQKGLSNFEQIASDFTGRDHYFHQVNCYFLGQFLKGKGVIASLANTDFDFQWRIASLLHDVGYEYEKRRSRARLKELLEMVDDEFICAMCKQLARWEVVGFDVRRYLRRKARSTGMDHGIAGAIIVFREIVDLYDDHNPDHLSSMSATPDGIDWSYKNIQNDVVPACAAILLHNLKAVPKIGLGTTPLAYVLRLCDTLQTWDRPLVFGKQPKAVSPGSGCDINVAGVNIEFVAAVKILARVKDELIHRLNDIDVADDRDQKLTIVLRRNMDVEGGAAG
ncbi:MAG: hypothetical protein HY897_20945 [Deltaproteobacteria bacterium]|nr:hypothetical protein [Deltaproteobacteria bacterium]